jgi:hypothetical protein
LAGLPPFRCWTRERKPLRPAGRSLLTGNPIEERKAAERAQGAARTFGAFADELVKELAPGFRNLKHRKQWSSTLQTYCSQIWNKPIEAIDTTDVLSVLSPIWLTKSETASRACPVRAEGPCKQFGVRPA